ncbi:zinc finger C2HC domain-containing protein 1C-like [Palaemon carinicauda]|uniref:zinc finger C2HC domain-containing protein 1C-like n=1 Tax=Palaemon carinicauda TaxID=392227 RepID=UPI0035B61A82
MHRSMEVLTERPLTSKSEARDVLTDLPFSVNHSFARKHFRRKSVPLHSYEEASVMATLGAPLPGNSMSSSNGTSRLAMMQARLREQLMVEKESRLLQMAARQEAERNNTIQRVTKTSASSLSSTLSSLNSSGAGQGRVRKMFEERRTNGYNHSPVGWDKSYPLEPVRGSGGSGGKPPKPKGIIRNNRGVSVDRGYQSYDSAAMKRSQSHATLQKNNNNYNDPRSPGRIGLRPPQQRVPAHHKSTSSLLDANQNYNGRGSSGSSGGYSRGPSRDPSPAPSPSHLNGNRFGFRNNVSRGPSPSPQSNGSPARSGPPPGLRRTQTSSYDEVDAGKTPPAHKRVFQPRQPVRQPRQRPPRQAPRQPSPEPEDEEEAPQRPPRQESKAPSIRARGPPITQVKSRNNNNNNEDEYQTPKPVAKSKPAPTFKSRGPTKSSVPPGLASCKICGRNFAPDRLEKHETICAKTKAKAKKRKVFDPVKMRTKGTEAEKFVARGKHLEKAPKPKKVDWRKKHEDFIATVRAAKGIKGYEAPPMDTSDYIQCPHCGRKFSEGVADRHIPKCASIQSNKPAAGRRR